MKIAKRFLLCSFLVVGCFFIPKQSHAGIIQNILNSIFGDKNDKKKDKQQNGSVPLDDRTVILVMAGLGLGAWMLSRAKAEKRVADAV